MEKKESKLVKYCRENNIIPVKIDGIPEKVIHQIVDEECRKLIDELKKRRDNG